MRKFPPKGFRPITPKDVKWGAKLWRHTKDKTLQPFTLEKLKESDIAPKPGTRTQWEDQMNVKEVNDRVYNDMKKIAETGLSYYIREEND